MGTYAGIINEENLNFAEPLFSDKIQSLLGDLLVTFYQDLAVLRIHDVVRGDSPEDILPGNRNMLDAGEFHLTDQRSGKLFPFPYDELVALRITDVGTRLNSNQVIRLEDQERLSPLKHDGIGLVKIVEQVFGGHSQSPEQNRGMELAAPVDADIKDISRIKLKIEPGTPVRDDSGGVKELTTGMGLSLIVLEKYPG
jgi:hypothetical protein